MNRPGVSGAIPEFATRQTSSRDVRGLSASATPLDLEGHKRDRLCVVILVGGPDDFPIASLPVGDVVQQNPWQI